MRIGIVVSYNEKYSDLARITVEENLKPYCKLHGYELYEDKQVSSRMDRCAAWNKIIACIEALPNYDWIMFLDVDCLIMNHTIKIEDIIDDTDASFIVPAHNIPAVDTPMLNDMGTDCVITSQFLVKNDEKGMAILEDIWEAKEWPKEMDINTFDYEGRQTRITIEKPEFDPHVKVVEEHVLNTFWYVNNPFIVFYNRGINNLVWKPGEFIVHVTSYSLEERIKLVDSLNFFSGGLVCGFVRTSDGTIKISALENLRDVKVYVQYDGITLNYSFTSMVNNMSYLLYANEELAKQNATVSVFHQETLVAKKYVMCKS